VDDVEDPFGHHHQHRSPHSRASLIQLLKANIQLKEIGEGKIIGQNKTPPMTQEGDSLVFTSRCSSNSSSESQPATDEDEVCKFCVLFIFKKYLIFFIIF
jgi:hypothetical protein